MAFLLGLIVAIGSLIAAIVHLDQEARFFWDFVAFSCVTGGTIAVALMTFPWQYRALIFRSFVGLFKTEKKNDGLALAECMDFIKAMQNGVTKYEGPTGSFMGEVLRDGAELIELGFQKNKVHEIIEERIHQNFERTLRVASAVRSLAKYPPAFGLAGTVLGLVTLMRNVSTGADAKQTGLMMAVALMATFYGLLAANLIINPAGENMAKSATADKKKAEIALHAVLLAAESVSLLEAQEVLNSYVMVNERINVLGAPTREAA